MVPRQELGVNGMEGVINPHPPSSLPLGISKNANIKQGLRCSNHQPSLVPEPGAIIQIMSALVLSHLSFRGVARYQSCTVVNRTEAENKNRRGI